jgi:3-isopropylmalate/(R)-2-methylmalate dehydratase small subunit
LNIGLPFLECEEAVKNTDNGDVLEVELSTGEIKISPKVRSSPQNLIPLMLELISSGGLIEYTKRKLQRA